MRTMILALVATTTACTTDDIIDPIDTETGVDTSAEETASEETATEHTGDTAAPEQIALIGDWIDNWGTDTVITEDAFIFPWSTQAIHSFDNDAQTALAVDASGEAEVWYRYDWTIEDDALWFCTAVYDGTSAEDAAGRPDSTRDAYDVDGCSGFAFSQLLEPIAIRGSWNLPESIGLEITKTTWTASSVSGSIAAFHNDDMYTVVNYSPDFTVTDQHIRYDWAESGGQMYLCETSTMPGTLAEAEALARPDDSAPTTAGCEPLGWRLMQPVAAD